MRTICSILFLMFFAQSLLAQAKITLIIAGHKAKPTILRQKAGMEKHLKEGMIVEKGDKIILPARVCLYVEYQGKWKLRQTFIGPKTIVIEEKNKEVKEQDKNVSKNLSEQNMKEKARKTPSLKVVPNVSRYGDKWAKKPLLEWVRSRGDRLFLSYPRFFLRNKEKLVFSWLPVKGSPVYLLTIQTLDEKILLQTQTSENQFLVTSPRVLHNPQGFIWSVQVEGNLQKYDSVRVYKLSPKREKQLQEIEQSLQSTLGENPQDLGAWWTLYEAYYRRGLYQEAINTYREITTRFVQDPTLTLPILFKICVTLKMNRELMKQFSGFDFCDILQQYLQRPDLDPTIRKKLSQELKDSELNCSKESIGNEEN